VRHFVELHGGVVRAWSEGLGQGATFTFTLPVAAVRISKKISGEPATLTPEESLEGRLKGVRVVVVEDDADSRELISEVLRRASAVVFVAASAVDALGAIVSERPDVLVSDIGLPGEDGFALMKRIRALPDAALARVPALALTAYTQYADQQTLSAAGFDLYLAKPVDPWSFVLSISRLVFDRTPS